MILSKDKQPGLTCFKKTACNQTGLDSTSGIIYSMPPPPSKGVMLITAAEEP
jgi:hypothetical protein